MSGRWSNYSEVDDYELEVDEIDLDAEEWDEQGAPSRNRPPRPPRRRTDGEIELEGEERDSKRNKPRRQAPPHKRREELG
jgi:hypothetical protein